MSIMLERPEWQRAALCRGYPSEMWFPAGHASSAEAKAICARCPVREPCLEYALANGDASGVWGGTSVRERRRITKVVSSGDAAVQPLG